MTARERRLRELGLLPASTGTGRPLPRPPLGVVAVLGGAGLALVVGGLLGAVLGAAAIVGVLRIVPRLESRSTRSRRARLAAQAPEVLDLLAACLTSGAPVQAAVAATADAVDEPCRTLLRQVAARLRLGAEAEVAWRAVALEPPLAPLAAAAERSARTGATLAAGLPVVAADLRARRRADVEAAARTVGVRLTAPLGLLFLPAFVLLGVVPVVASLLPTVLLPG